MVEYENNTVVETQPAEPEDNNGRNWLRLVGVIFAAVLVAVLLILAARWIYNAITDDNAPGTTSVEPADESKLPPRPGEENENKPSTQGGSTSSTNTSTPSDTGSQSATQTPNTGNKLPNSGPEHVAAIFAGSSLAGAGLHYFVSRKRNS